MYPVIRSGTVNGRITTKGFTLIFFFSFVPDEVARGHNQQTPCSGIRRSPLAKTVSIFDFSREGVRVVRVYYFFVLRYPFDKIHVFCVVLMLSLCGIRLLFYSFTFTLVVYYRK